ncbi:MAG: hypothetical protein RIR51_695 [Bacteroidota bacterium]|jgi:predicted esterase
MKKLLLFLLILTNGLFAQDYQLKKDLQYQSGDEYMNERNKLDVYFSSELKDAPVLIFFHGGSIKAGSKYIPKNLEEQGIVVVTANYRLYPKVSVKEAVEDAAAVVKWTVDHIKEYGGSVDKLFITGHSAGGYLASMVALDSSYLRKYGLDQNVFAGIIPLSGHQITHMTVREAQGISPVQATIDEMAPIHYTRKDTPPYIMITGDRELELLGRYEENAYMWRMMKLNGNKNTELYELDGYNHGGMVEPAIPLLIRRIREISK